MFIPRRPKPLDWKERERVLELQVWLGCVKTCATCHADVPIEIFETSDEVCQPCVMQRNQDRMRAATRARYAVMHPQRKPRGAYRRQSA